jgi:hypothetical protein
VLSLANVGGRDVAEHMLAVEATWQARQSSFVVWVSTAPGGA